MTPAPCRTCEVRNACRLLSDEGSCADLRDWRLEEEDREFRAAQLARRTPEQKAADFRKLDDALAESKWADKRGIIGDGEAA